MGAQAVRLSYLGYREMYLSTLEKIYEVLVTLGGASPDMRESFLNNHLDDNCTEWRFGGHLGFGGKYRSRKNAVDCYPEDRTRERDALIGQINAALAQI